MWEQQDGGKSPFTEEQLRQYQQRQQWEMPGGSHPQNQYNNFVSRNPANAQSTEYPDVFVGAESADHAAAGDEPVGYRYPESSYRRSSRPIPPQFAPHGSTRHVIPSINVVQTTPDLIHNQTSSTFSEQRPEVQHYFNEEDYYYNIEQPEIQNENYEMNNTGYMPQTDPYYNRSEQQLEPNRTSAELAQTNGFGLLDEAPNSQSNTFYRTGLSGRFSDSISEVDPEACYVDQSGDDYQINSYLGKGGEMINPYDSHYSDGREFLTTNYYNAAYEGGQFGTLDEAKEEEEEDLSSTSIISEYTHEDFGETDKNDIRVYDRTKFGSSRSELSTFSANSKDIFINGEDSQNAARRPKRIGTEIRKFRLWKGNFVFDSPISRALLTQYNTAVDNSNMLTNEFKFMRYQAVTCEPNELAANNFTVRQLKYAVPRTTEMLIVITMYNEDHILLGRTLKGVMDNIKFMVKRKRSSTWGPDAWKKIVICIVSDGRSKINEKSLALLSALGCYQDGFAKEEINGKKVGMHVYEHTSMINITNVTEEGVELTSNSGTVPTQLLFCLKEENKQKINSHRWAFEGFAELLQPNIVTLLDAGTMPGKDSIYQLWQEFKNPNVGGSCGEIKTYLGNGFSKLLNPLVASQNFEYKMSNILDKTTESNFGFITVLPGAFSAYRFEAVKGQPLEKYFYGEDMGDKGFHFFSSNMYLAEDRILCFEVVTKKNSQWILKYCRSAYAATDVPERVPEFILQRRRWLNGSFFASVYSFFHFYRIWTSGHHIGMKLLLNLEFLYLLFNTVLSWFSLSSFFLVFRILTFSIAISYKSVFNVLSVIFLWLYGVCLLSTFILSLGNKPKSTEKYYVITCIFFAVLMIYMIFCSIFMSVKSFQNLLRGQDITFAGLITQEAFRDIVISLGSTFCLYWFSSIVYLQPWHMLTSFVQYLLLSPSYVNVLNIYAFCNVHDLSWGTKGTAAKPLGKITAKEDGTFKMEIMVSNKEIQANYDKYMDILAGKYDTDLSNHQEMSMEEKKTGYYANVRSLVIIFWILTNFGVIAAVLETGGISSYFALRNSASKEITQTVETQLLTNKATIYFTVILWLVALSAVIRFLGCVLYMTSRAIKKIARRH